MNEEIIKALENLERLAKESMEQSKKIIAMIDDNLLQAKYKDYTNEQLEAEELSRCFECEKVFESTPKGLALDVFDAVGKNFCSNACAEKHYGYCDECGEVEEKSTLEKNGGVCNDCVRIERNFNSGNGNYFERIVK